jgi:sec-independent protein translocase protein TatA
MALGTPELLIALFILLLLFGGSKLPGLAKAVGESLNSFKKTQDDYQKKKEEQIK